MGKIAIYSGPGTQGFIPPLENAFKIFTLTIEKIDAKGIREKLNKFKILIIPGGWTEKYVSTLSKNNSHFKIKDFVSRGGKYIGICAGAYFASKECICVKRGKEIKLEGLGITKAECKRQSLRMEAGRLRKIKLKKHFLTKNCPPKLNIWYQNGPEIISGKGVKIVATYEDDSGAIALSKYGKGTVILFSPHPEGDPGGKINPQKLGTLTLLKNTIGY